jgi:hypothetical protein
MPPSGPHWDTVVSNLARHLATAADVEHVERILADADRDLGHLRAPSNFWSRVTAAYERTLETHVSSQVPPEAVRRLLGTRTLVLKK